MNPQLRNEILNKPKPLSEEQRNAVISEKKYIRVIAGAGTGKTETLTRRIIFLLLCQDIEPKEIVAFTFTEKAAQSMKSRIYQRIKELKSEKICAKLGEMYVGTIHGYCLRILQDYFGYGDYDVLDENQEMAFVLREGWGLGLNKGGRYAENCQNFIKSVNVVYNELIDRKKLNKKDTEFFKQLEKYESLLDTHRLLTFGRMVYLAVEKIKEAPQKLNYIKHLIVDEYQDINKAQEELIKIIGENASVFIVGDPRQSIYQWRGSNEKCFENFPKLFKDVETFILKENRRSVKPIVDVANTFANKFERAPYEPIIPIRKEAGLALKIEFETPDEEAEWIVSQIRSYVEEGKCKYNDCAILLRSVKTSAEPFIKALKRYNIPYIVGGKVGLFKRDEAQAIGRLFCWLWDNGFWDEDQWRRQKQTKGEDLLSSGIKLWQSATNIININRRKLKEWKERVKKGEYKNFTQIFHELLIILGYKDLNPEDKMHAAIMANLGRFSCLLADYESSIRLGGNKPNWEDALKGLCWYINTYARGAYEEQPSGDIRDIDAVQIMTIHQAKGLEWPIVFVPCMVDKRFPSSMVGYKQKWYVPEDLFDVKRYEGELEDERRIFYVAITRARDILCVSYFVKNKKRSQFINDIEKSKLLMEISPSESIPKIKISRPTLEDEILTFSAREILTYMKCPYFYRLREMWNYKPGLVEALGYGKSLHYCLHYASDLIAQGMEPKKAIQKAVDEKFHVPYASSAEKENMKKKAEKVLLNFVNRHSENMKKIEEVEVRLEFPVQKATITGKVDVIFKEENKIEVRDYKTSDEVTSYEQAAFQVQLYTLGLQMIGRPVTQASIAYLEEDNEEEQIKEVKIEKYDLENAKKNAEKCINDIIKGQFEAKPQNGYCKHCDQKEICKYVSNC